ncbi:set domain-containing protein [Ophiostoma piceae UAMH 11346]|uniref:Set domain-containing protein n=1 Tax=Ophiostoma piceae (strain UAMH 11346) TaxID=1262450 RepID=S3BPA8_OPHP1|nr:set domain-containing protein [Ophiostoma piceae UAMH 11346]
MAHTQLPLETLPLWQSLNNVVFSSTHLAAIPAKGSGLVAGDEGNDGSAGALISVPSELVLHVEAVEEYAKQDRNFRQLLDAAGHQSARGDILLFLLVQLVVGLSQPGEELASLPVPWTEYVKFLPDDNAVEAKIVALEHEFDELREKSSNLPFWQAALWERESGPQLRHWFLVDAWYRSRCLDLPRSGPSMVPCIDMVNHSATPNAYYEELSSAVSVAADKVVLLLRPGQRVAASDEITISYSGSGESGSSDVKPASEMLFSYGFIDPKSARHSLVLPFRPFPDDPLAKAKLHVSGGPAQRLEVELLGDAADEDEDTLGASKVRWTCPFAYLMCVNEEDGLDFRLQQETDGSTQLRMFWQDVDVTESAQDFPSLLSTHQLAPIFYLRVVTVLQEAIEAQLERMQAAGGDQVETDDEDNDDDEMGDGQEQDDIEDGDVRSALATQAAILRDIESRVLSSALESLEAERSDLLSNATVVAYLGSMEASENTLAHEHAPNQGQDDEAMNEGADDDFS